uniref:Dynein heavy chain putative n=1 Tax=Albugo laibachii Nc14 TaxID=890382 RepID=F0WS02_9STRA|nr:dynein heavy chain putative [Albugo laibachii Nc14]|eukprot:CCA24119.1 dynein heavy chain putative [Albugo laibachii Nc14]
MSFRAGSESIPPGWVTGDTFDRSPSKTPVRMARIKMLQSSINARNYQETSTDSSLIAKKSNTDELSDAFPDGVDLRAILGPLGSLKGSSGSLHDAVMSPVTPDARYYRRTSDRIAANYTPTAMALNLEMLSALIKRASTSHRNPSSHEFYCNTSLDTSGHSRELCKADLGSQDVRMDKPYRCKLALNFTPSSGNFENELKNYRDTMKAYRQQLNNYIHQARKAKHIKCIPQNILQRVKISAANQVDRNRGVVESMNDTLIHDLFQDVFADYFETTARSMLNYDIMDALRGLHLNICAPYLKAKQMWWYDELYSSYDWKVLRKTPICHEEVQNAREKIAQRLFSIHPVLLALQEQHLTEAIPSEWSLKLHHQANSADMRLPCSVSGSKANYKRLTASGVLFVSFSDKNFISNNPQTLSEFTETFNNRVEKAREFCSNFWLEETAERLSQCIKQFVTAPRQNRPLTTSDDEHYRNHGGYKSKICSPISRITRDSKPLFSEVLDSTAILMSRNIRENVQASIQAFVHYFEQFLDPEYQGEAALLLSVKPDPKFDGMGKALCNAVHLMCFVVEPSVHVLHDQIKNCINMLVRIAHDLPRIDGRVLPSANFTKNLFLGPCTMQVDDDIAVDATMRLSSIFEQQINHISIVLTKLDDYKMLFDGSYKAKAAQLLNELDKVKASTSNTLDMADRELSDLARLSKDFDAKIHDKYSFQIFAISCADIKQKIVAAVRVYTTRILAKLAADNSVHMDKLSHEFDEIAQKLVLEPVDFDELSILAGYHKQSQKDIELLNSRFYDDVCRRIYFLECHDYVLSREDIHSFLNLHRWPEGIKAFQRKSMEMQARRRHELEIIMEERHDQLSSHCLTLQHRIEKMRDYNNVNDATTYLKRISAVKQLVSEVEVEADTIQEQGRFLTDKTNLNAQSLILGLKQILEPIENLWSVVSEALAFIHSSREARHHIVESDDIQQHCMEYRDKIVLIMDEYKKHEVHATGVSVAHDLMGMLDEIMENVGRVPQ